MGHAENHWWKGVFQRLRLMLVARRVLALAPTGDTTACFDMNSFVGGVRAFSLADALEDGVEREFSDELLMLACLVGCRAAVAPLAGLFDAGSSTAGSGRACFLAATTGADTIGEGAAALNKAGEVFWIWPRTRGFGPAAAWATLGGVKGDATVPAADDAAAAATNKLGSMISVTERRIVEFSQTLPELRTSSSLRQSLDSMLAFLETSALDL